MPRNALQGALTVLVLLLGCPGGTHLLAQETAPVPWVLVDSIRIDGNRKTRDKIILRELDFRSGDTLEWTTLPDRLESNRLRVLNLGLFTSAAVYLRNWQPGNRVHIQIDVKESWYVYPAPVFELADRNFNVWWEEFDRSLKRVNYGLNWFQLNFSGRADVLYASAHFGYVNRYSLSYTSPFINRRQTLGMQAGIAYSRAHEVAIATSANKLLFRTDPDVWQITRLHANLGFTWRPDYFDTQTIILEWHDNTVADTIARMLNTDFFLAERTRQRHLSLLYGFTSDHRDIRPYPHRGWLGKIELRWNGLLPSDQLFLGRFRGEWRQYLSFSKRLSLETILVARGSLPRRKPPYFNNQALGYGNDFVRGYEYYVADGLDFGLLKTGLHVECLNRVFNLGRLVPLEAYRSFPVKCYLSINNDLGYANDPWYAALNPLSNRVLWGYGIGLDLVLYYDKVFRIEWTRNDRGEQGFYLHATTGF